MAGPEANGPQAPGEFAEESRRHLLEKGNASEQVGGASVASHLQVSQSWCRPNEAVDRGSNLQLMLAVGSE